MKEAEYAIWLFEWIEKQAWELQQNLIGRPEFAAQVEALDTIIHTSTEARTSLQMENAREQLEDHSARR